MLKTKPFPYQRAGVLGIDQFGGRCLLGDEQGLGKCFQSLWWLEKHPDARPAVVVCPASVKYVWEHEAALHFGLRAAVLEGRHRPRRHRGTIANAPLVVLNYDILSSWLPWLLELRPQTIILDECQALAHLGTQRTKAATMLCRRVPHVLALSGTPLMNSPAELWPVLNILQPKEYPSFFPFVAKYSRPKLEYGKWRYKGARRLPQLHARLRRTVLIRRLKKDVMKDLPPKTRAVVPLPLADMSEYWQAVHDFRMWLHAAHPDRRSSLHAEALVKVGYLLRLCGDMKHAALEAWLQDWLAGGDGKLLMFAEHRSRVLALAGAVPGAQFIHGGTPLHKRKLRMQQFQRDPACRLLVTNRSTNTGVTLTAASAVAFAELYWRPADHLQAEDRAHRPGQTRALACWYLVAHGTVEERLCAMIQRKAAIISGALDGGDGEPLPVWDLLQELELNDPTPPRYRRGQRRVVQ